MANIDVEDVGDKLISIFQANLPSAIANVEKRKTTAYNPDSVPSDSWFFGEVNTTPLMPAVIVAADSTGTTSEDEYGWRQQSYAMIVELNYEAEDAEKCRRIISRYGAAIDDILRSNNAVAGYWQDITGIRQEFSDTWKTQQGTLLQTVRVSFNVILFTD